MRRPGATSWPRPPSPRCAASPDPRACLLANHGPVALGIGLGHALLVAHQVEWIAAISHVAATVGQVHVIEPRHQEQMAATYRCTIAREVRP